MRPRAPRPRAPRAWQVVLCNPLGYEAMSAHRTYRHLAERLSARGFPALRFDYDGTGDSSGRLVEPGRVRAWLDSIRAATMEARVRSGARVVALFGVRLGATLATVAANEIRDVEALVLWAPIVSGRAHVRELQAFRLLNKARVTPARADGSVEVGGYLFGRDTLADLSAIDLLAMPGRDDALSRRTLILARGERPAADETRFVAGLKARGRTCSSFRSRATRG